MSCTRTGRDCWTSHVALESLVWVSAVSCYDEKREDGGVNGVEEIRPR